MNQGYLQKIVKAALGEDIGKGDITTNSLIPANATVEAHLVFKSKGVVCGLNVAECVFKTFSKKIEFHRAVPEGSWIDGHKVVAIIKGPTRAILTAERVAINFLIHLSAVATRTKALVDHVHPYPSKNL